MYILGVGKHNQGDGMGQYIVQGEPGMEFYDVQVRGCTHEAQHVGGKDVITGVLTLELLNGDTQIVIINKNIDISIRYGEFMTIARKVRLYKKGQSRVNSDGNGNLVAQIELGLAPRELGEGLKPGETGFAALRS